MSGHRKSFEDFYLRGGDEGKDIFEVWERGGAQGNAVTPSTYSAGYRTWIHDLLRKFLDERPQSRLLSVGCGNAMVESLVCQDGYPVLGIDLLEKAVEYARSKGVDAVRADVLSWSPEPAPWTVVYADGLLGHLYDPATDLQPVLGRFRSWLATGAGALVLSNDGPATPADVEPHPGLDGFHYLSASYLCRQVEAAGFRDVWSTLFTYQRPLTGPRERVVLTARA